MYIRGSAATLPCELGIGERTCITDIPHVYYTDSQSNQDGLRVSLRVYMQPTCIIYVTG